MAEKQPEKTPSPIIRVTCDKCGADLLAEEQDAGRKAACPDCGATMTVPDSTDQALREEIAALPEKPPSEAAGPAPPPSSDRLRLKDEVVIEKEPTETEAGELAGAPAQPPQEPEAPFR